MDIYFTSVGSFSIPTEKELQTMMEEIRKPLSDSMFLHKAKHGEAPLNSGLHHILHNYFVINPCLCISVFYTCLQVNKMT